MHPFRPDLLGGRSIALAGALPPAIGDLLEELGARVCELDPVSPDDEESVSEWARSAAPLDALICTARDGLLADAWAPVRAVATAVFIPTGKGRIVLLAPAEGAAAAGLENLARTLSVEWARFGLTTVTIAPGPAANDEQLATLTAFLCSPAGGYFSGCHFDLGLGG